MSDHFPNMKLLTAIAVASLTIANYSAKAEDASFKVGKMYTTQKAGEAVVIEGGTYVVLPVTMKNLTPKEQSVGGAYKLQAEAR